MAYSPHRRHWRSSLPRPWALASSSCSGSSAEVADLPDQVAERDLHVGKMHPPTRKKHAEDGDFAPHAVGALVVRIRVGPHPQIASFTFTDALGRHEAF